MTPGYVWFVRQIVSGHQQDLPNTTFFRRRVSLGRFTERQFLADGDDQPAVPHCFGHELERSPVGFRGYERHLYGWIVRGVPRHRENRSKDSSRLDLGDQL